MNPNGITNCKWNIIPYLFEFQGQAAIFRLNTSRRLLFFYFVALGVLLVSGSWLVSAIGTQDGQLFFVSERFFLGLMLACVTLLAMVIGTVALGIGLARFRRIRG